MNDSKKQWRKWALAILNPLKPFYSAGCARLNLGDTSAYYDKDAIEMEAFSRPLWAIAPFFAGGGYDEDFFNIYRKGIVSGTDPQSDEYWGKCMDYDQKFVEMASISLGIIIAPDLLWNPLSDKEKENLSGYLLQINDHFLPSCNWLMFAVMVNVAMKKVGRAYNEERLFWYLDEIENYYVKDGWYQDGNPGNRDYYVSFGIHYYCLLYAFLMREEDEERSLRYIERAEVFGRDFALWMDAEGAAIPYGRSQIYRFAQGSFYSACILAGAKPYSVAVMKGFIERHFLDWMKKPIVDNAGILTIGYGYGNLFVSDKYNAPGSPYWAMKLFTVLMLDDEHEFWKVKAEKYPEKEGIYYVPAAEMIYVQNLTHTTAYVPGTIKGVWHGQAPAKYSKFAYDSRFGISASRSNVDVSEIAADCMLVFEVEGLLYERRGVSSYIVEEGRIVSRWSPVRGINVETIIIPEQDGHRRIHKIKSDIQCVAYDGGFAIDRSAASKYSQEDDSGFALAKNKTAVSSIVDEESTYVKRGVVIHAAPNTHYLYPKSAIPAIRYEIEKGEGEIFTKVFCEIRK